MPWARAALTFVASVLLLASRAEARPLRVMSLNECSDQLVLALLPPERITSVTWLSRDPSISVMARAAARTPVNHGSAEEVLRDHPDLVIASDYATPATRALLEKLHYPLLVLGPSDSFEDIRRITRQVAAAVGERARGEALIAHMEATLRQLSGAAGPPLRIAAWDGAGFSARPGTLYDLVLKAAGARNVASEPGILNATAPDVETLLATAPILLVKGTPGVELPGRSTDVSNNPIVRRVWAGRTVIVPQAYYI